MKKKKKLKKPVKIIIICAIVAAAIAAAIVLIRGSKKNQVVPVYQVAMVNTGMMEDDEGYQATVSNGKIQNAVLKEGVVESVDVKKGDAVKKGDVIMRYDVSSYNINVEKDEAEIYKIEADMAKSQENISMYANLRPSEEAPQEYTITVDNGPLYVMSELYGGHVKGGASEYNITLNTIISLDFLRTLRSQGGKAVLHVYDGNEKTGTYKINGDDLPYEVKKYELANPAPHTTVQVPDVKGEKEVKAVSNLTSKGLNVDIEYKADPDNVGKVISQDIKPGTGVVRGTDIGITVGVRAKPEPETETKEPETETLEPETETDEPETETEEPGTEIPDPETETYEPETTEEPDDQEETAEEEKETETEKNRSRRVDTDMIGSDDPDYYTEQEVDPLDDSQADNWQLKRIIDYDGAYASVKLASDYAYYGTFEACEPEVYERYTEEYVEPEDDDSDNYVYSRAELQQMISEEQKKILDYELQLEEANIRYEEDKAVSETGEVKAAIDGVVTKTRSLSKSSVGETVITIKGDSNYAVAIYVNEMDLPDIKTGDTFTVNSYESGNQFEAVVDEISTTPLASGLGYSTGNPNSSVYPVTATVKEKDIELTLGESCQAIPEGEEQPEDVINLPVMFVRSDPGGSYVMKSADGRLVKEYVRTGKNYWGYVIEIKSGLSQDDYIAFPYDIGENEGAPVEISEEVIY